MVLPIVQAPNQVLLGTAQPVKKIDKDILELIENMKETLVVQHDPEGIGLAAPQVGRSLRLFVVKENKSAPFFVFINPEITLIPSQSKKTQNPPKHWEGCLSLKDIWGKVTRPPKVHITWMDENGEHHDETFGKFFAIILQHEYDHLEGKLFPIHTLSQGNKLFKSHKDKNGDEVFDEIKL